MKILQRYILREHIAPFFFAFFTVTFLLIVDTIPRIIDHVIDKDLSILVVLELVWLNLAWMMALSVPMAVLVATLMAFGRLSSDFEITAIKASGINLLHIIIPLLIAGGVITFGMIQFNDKVLPDMNKKWRLLWGDISAMRPTMIFRSNAFITDIPGYIILIDDINHTTSEVRGVRINDTRMPNKPRIIVADHGLLKSTDNGRNMQFTLYDGEVHTLDLAEPDNYRKVQFENQVINIEGTASELVRTESETRTDREKGIDEMRQDVAQSKASMQSAQERIMTNFDSRAAYLFADTFAYNLKRDTISDSAALALVRQDCDVFLRHIERNYQQIDAQKQQRDKFQIEIYKKYSIPAASLAFILIGAPLGMMTRRSGMGVAIAVSIILFLVYWAFLIGGEDLADRGLVEPFWAMWSANILMGAIGLYLIYVVVTEKPLFSWFRSQA